MQQYIHQKNFWQKIVMSDKTHFLLNGGEKMSERESERARKRAKERGRERMYRIYLSRVAKVMGS